MATTLIPIAAYEVLRSLDALRVQKSPMLTAGYTEHGDMKTRNVARTRPLKRCERGR